LASDANQSVHIVADEGLEAYLPLADMVDLSEEVNRLSKMQSGYDALVAGLNSPSMWLLLSCFHRVLAIHLFHVQSCTFFLIC
jgi:hypothetical protein